ncbi:MAG: cobalamin biosynthesis protein CbiD [Oscillospiraceae bacterium]|nr:cobalamin biosynthesis protein CbiD [Oscillospiraceae bacterium]
MSFEHYVRSGTKQLRRGYTTGTCAALAAAGAAELLLTGKEPETLSLLTPGGLRVEVKPEYIRPEGRAAVCAVRKDAGDDPDVTNGMLVFARVEKQARGILLEAGDGIGQVTKPGLDQAVGVAAINSVPRKMILAAAETVCAETGYDGGLKITVSVPGGGEIAKKTFNPQLGIEGGISILGTSGIVEPMSERAIVDTIALEIRQAAASGSEVLILTPGNYGMDFLHGKFPQLAEIPAAKCSNFIGDAIDIAVTEGFAEVLLVGHVGKLVKLAGGIMNTHSKTADCRRELFCAHAAVCGAGTETCRALMEQISADGCLAILESAGLREQVTESLLKEIQTRLDRRACGALRIGAILFSNEYGLLGETEAVKNLQFLRRANA